MKRAWMYLEADWSDSVCNVYVTEYAGISVCYYRPLNKKIHVL